MIAERLVAALILAIVLDLVLGDPKNKYHPVRWLGNFLDFFIPRLKVKTLTDHHGVEVTRHIMSEKVKGTVFVFCLLGIFGLYFTTVFVYKFKFIWIYSCNNYLCNNLKDYHCNKGNGSA